MEFYADKSRDLSRFIYRNFFDLLAKDSSAAARGELVNKFCQFIADLKLEGDWQKMKWCLPVSAVNPGLSASETRQIEETLVHKRKKRNDRLVEVYPHCSDEFSTTVAFLDAAFGSRRFDFIDPATRIFTMGSCFARNIANYLQHRGFTISPFIQAEDLNSPFSNAKLLAVCTAAPRLQRAYIEHWVDVLYPKDAGVDLAAVVKMELQRLEALLAALKASEFLIVTYGNVLDYFLPPTPAEFEVGPAIAPKFLTISTNEDIALRSHLTGKLKTAGAEFRIGSYAEVSEALDALYKAIRTINPTARLLLTLSPVPIDSAIGIKHSANLSAVEIDCVSKSLLRAALNEFLEKHQADDKLFYFPSFEIVRWIAPNIGSAVFGKEDAASRHVSQEVLNGVYEYFIYKFCASAGAEKQPIAATL